MIVVDTHVICSILLEPTDTKDQFILENTFIAPAFVKLELVNILRKAHFFNGIPLESALNYFEQGVNLYSEFIDDVQLFELATDLSFKLNHPIYDCLFLALAKSRNIPIATLDQKLMAKAHILNVKTMVFNS